MKKVMFFCLALGFSVFAHGADKRKPNAEQPVGGGGREIVLKCDDGGTLKCSYAPTVTPGYRVTNCIYFGATAQQNPEANQIDFGRSPDHDMKVVHFRNENMILTVNKGKIKRGGDPELPLTASMRFIESKPDDDDQYTCKMEK